MDMHITINDKSRDEGGKRMTTYHQSFIIDYFLLYCTCYNPIQLAALNRPVQHVLCHFTKSRRGYNCMTYLYLHDSLFISVYFISFVFHFILSFIISHVPPLTLFTVEWKCASVQ